MKLKYDFNEFGTRISVHKCEFCGREFTVCPAIPEEKEDEWKGCLAPDCSSYDVERDVDKLIEENKVLFFPKDRLN